jgi:hypothetical protein
MLAPITAACLPIGPFFCSVIAASFRLVRH